MSFLDKIFIDVDTLPKDGYGFVELLYLGATYAYILMVGSNMIKDGSELLLLVPQYSGVVGSIVLPVLGAVPDGAIVLFSGLGPDAQVEVAVGVGALAGSTIMLLTIPWCLSILAGRVNLNANGDGNYVRPRGASKEWSKLSPADRYSGTGVNVAPAIKHTAKVMVLTLIPFFIIQIPAIFGHCTFTAEEKQCTTPTMAPLLGCVVAIALFLFYLKDQADIANTDPIKQDIIDELRTNAINQHMVSLRGLFPSQVMDSEGEIQISADNKRFRHFLKPFFRQFDADGSGEIDKNEFCALVRSMGEQPSKETVDTMMAHMDKDKSGAIDFDEFVHAMVELLTEVSVDAGADTKDDGKVVEENADDEGEDVEEEAEMPEDLAELSPEEQQSKLLRRSCWQMGLGVGMVLVFSDPMVSVMSSMGDRTGIRPFFVAFCLAPLASNASEFIAAFAYAQKKTVKTITISFSSLLGAACMNNTFCLAIFLALVYLKNLKWVFSAETFSIIVVELIMFFFALKRVHPSYYSVLVISLFPLALILVSWMESMGFD